MGHWQQAAWIGGRKNDLVVCFGGGNHVEAPAWVYVFGWSESAVCKRNLESLMIGEPLSLSLLSKLEREITANYRIKDWTKFDYIRVEPPGWCYWVYFSVLGITQGLLYVGFHRNKASKGRWYDFGAIFGVD
jgi:hypothetical protein